MSSTQVLYNNIKTILQDQLQDKKPLLGSSIDQDIVVFLGATGAGKSTLINILNDKDLHLNNDDEFEVKHIEDTSYMVIGMNSKSETFLPRSVKVGELMFYDLPGFDDNRGAAINLVNASYIKNIIENAKSVRMVFVAGQEETTSSRGDSFKKLLVISKSLFPNSQATEKSSLLVVTKSQKKTSEQLIEFLKKKIDKIEDFHNWLNLHRTLPMSRDLDVQQKENINRMITKLTPSKIDLMNIESIYSTDVRNDLRHIFKYEMNGSLDKIYNGYKVKQSTLEEIKLSMEYFEYSFQKDINHDIERSDILKLMRPIVDKIYTEEQEKFMKQVKEKILLVLSQLETEKTKLEKNIVQERADEQKKKDDNIINLQRIEQQKQVETNTLLHQSSIEQQRVSNEQLGQSQQIIEKQRQDFSKQISDNNSMVETMAQQKLQWQQQKNVDETAQLKAELTKQGQYSANQAEQHKWQMERMEHEQKCTQERLRNVEENARANAARPPEVRTVEAKKDDGCILQ